MSSSGYIETLERELVAASRRLQRDAEAGAGRPRLLRPRRLVLLTFSLALVAAAATLLALQPGGGGPPAAYAVTQNSDGTVTLTLDELLGVQPADEQLAKLGVPVVVRRVEAGCDEEGRTVNLNGGGAAIPSMVETVKNGSGLEGLTWVIHPAAIPAGDTLGITVQIDPNSRIPAVGSGMALFEGQAPSCSRPGLFG
jgi:hypothetical protein